MGNKRYSVSQEGKSMTQYSLDQALRAQSVLRAAAGAGEERFDEQQLVGMLSDEIRALRESGSSDQDIAALLKTDVGIDLSAEMIQEFYVDTSGYGRRDS